ncbi:MAG TPA: S41 family peptidase [Chloroflexota bacterium]|nr:S41 family peptidase [Chloroflexota bacterium]
MQLRRFLYAGGLALSFALGTVVSPLATQAEDVRPELTAFWKAWDLAHEHFVYRDALVPERMLRGAIAGMVEALGDDGHTRYLSPDDVRRERAVQRGRYDGIGAEVNMRGGRPVVVAPIEGSPAERAGLRAGDSIVAVDGLEVTSLSLSELVERVRGPRGSTVTLTVVRLNDSASLEIPIRRDEITVRPVTWTMVPGAAVGHIRINRFAATTTDELKQAITAARERGAEALLIDLRNNPGGQLNQVVSSASQFLTQGDVLLEENAKGERKGYPVQPGGLATDLPIAVLINRGSASASEIFAGAIQDHGRGEVVGERTFGTGTVLFPYDLPDGSQLYLGVAQWLTPNGRVIRKIGVKPDVPVALAGDVQPLSPRQERALSVEELLAQKDAQLLRGLEVLGRLPEPARELVPAA